MSKLSIIPNPSTPSLREALEDLKSLEWAGTSEHVDGCCPVCLNYPIEGHDQWCRFGEVLTALLAAGDTPQHAPQSRWCIFDSIDGVASCGGHGVALVHGAIGWTCRVGRVTFEFGCEFGHASRSSTPLRAKDTPRETQEPTMEIVETREVCTLCGGRGIEYSYQNSSGQQPCRGCRGSGQVLTKTVTQYLLPESQAPAGAPATCQWTETKYGWYQTACGPARDVPKFGAQRFCAFCGKPLTVIPYTSQEAE